MKIRILHIIAAIILIVSTNTIAREFRVAQIPNGSKFGCLNCHVSSFGGTRNAFGQLVQTKYLTFQGDVVWNAAIAGEDADADGVSNGQELQDPTGAWRVGQANPGVLANVSNPGDRNSKPTSIELDDLKMPTTYSLAQNYPNPFNPTTTISYNLQAASYVTLKVYDVLGGEVATLVDVFQNAGIYNSQFSIRHTNSPRSTRVGAGQLSSGIYFYRLTARSPSAGSGHSFVQTKKMVLTK
ncbi:MAG: hypothetical protein FD143_2824 [Ignavibacteria bacterium]|nr:MAG: hypothetical protein FD143_2824 [Ignavibacteria bacterium]KAF0155644.1 MAG: hypothetical protein FD188_3112 [Ignavibacteria bacterium]